VDEGGLADIAVTPLQGKNDGYYANVTYIEFGSSSEFYLLTRMEFGFLYGMGYGLNFWASTHAKATGEQIDSWTWTIYPGVFKLGTKNLCMRPVVGYGGYVYIFFNDPAANKISYIKADPVTGALPTMPTALTGIQPSLDITSLDACLMGDGKTICIAYLGDVFPFSQPNVICLDTQFDTVAGSSVVYPTEVYGWRMATWAFDDYAGDPTAFVAWWSIWTNQLLVLTVSASADVVRSKDGAGTPLDLVSLAAGYPATAVAGVATYENVHVQDAGTASVLMSTRASSGFGWLFGLATGSPRRPRPSTTSRAADPEP